MEHDQPQRILWIVAVSNDRQTEVTHTYATDEQEARQNKQAWVQQRQRRFPTCTCKPYPHGFMMGTTRLPGTEVEPETRL